MGKGKKTAETKSSSGKGKKTAETSSVSERGYGNVVGLDSEFPDGFDFTYCHVPDDFIHDKATPNRASLSMKPEHHPWLQFRDASRNDRVIFTNKLAEIQDFPVAKPKIIDWDLLARLGIRDDILRMLETKGPNERHVWTNVDMWGRIFRTNTLARKEWCLEFYSTLEVENILIARDISMKQTIHFRLGGIQRHCTAIGFAYLTGMLTADEMREEWIHDFLDKSHFNYSAFPDNKTFDAYWLQISGQPGHNPYSSKLSQIRSKRLRILHKMITFSFLHRGDNNNKVYSDDLWLLGYFSELSPGLHVLAPYILARHMSRHKEQRLLCGHFVSMIATRLGVVDRRENNGNLSNAVQVGIIRDLDLVKSNILSRDKTSLLDDGEGPEPARRVRRRAAPETESESEEDEEDAAQRFGPQPYGFNDIRDALDRMGGRFDDVSGHLRRLSEHQTFIIEQQRYLSSQQHQMGYTLDYYRPVWQHSLEQMYQGRPDPDDRTIPVYSPPELYTPRHFQSDYPYPSYTQNGGAGTGHQAGTSFYTGQAGSSGAGEAGLFGTQHGAGGGVPSIFEAPKRD